MHHLPQGRGLKRQGRTMKQGMLTYALAGVLALALMLAPVSDARAELITFEMHSDLFNGPMQPAQVAAFDADTGGGAANRDVLTRFTIDTSTPISPSASDTYFFSSPGTGMSVTIGDLTIFYSTFGLELGDARVTGGVGCEGLAVFSGSTLGSVEHGSLFQMSDCGSGQSLADDSLASFANGPLSAFHAVTVESVVNSPTEVPLPDAPGVTEAAWYATGNTYSLVRVPEPGTVELVLLGFAAVPLLRRRR